MSALMGFIPQIVSIVGMAVGIVEKVQGDKHGAEKQTAAVGLIGVLGGLLDGFDIRWLSDAEVLDALKGLIDAVVKFSNSVEAAKAKS